MTCFLCFDSAFDVEHEDEPVVDLDRVIKDIAWRELRDFPPERLTWRERMCRLEKTVWLDVDKSFLSIHPSRTMRLEMRRSDSGGVALPQVSGGATVLFQSQYQNDTDVPQTYSFKTERQTKSMVELSLQRGFTMGSTLEVDMKIPTGIEGCGLSGKLGGQLQWNFTRGKRTRQEEEVTWAVDNHVEVAAHKTGIAKLSVHECQWTADFTLPCLIHALPHPSSRQAPGHSPQPSPGPPRMEPGDGETEDPEDAGDGDPASRLTVVEQNRAPKATKAKIPVFVRRKTTDDLLKVIYIPCSAVCKECPSHLSLSPDDPGAIVCELHGACHVVCAVEQKVRLREATFVDREPQRSDEPNYGAVY